MKNTTESTLDAAEVFGLVSKYRSLIVTVTALTLAVFVAASFVLPKKYKSHFALTIYAKYFQNPLIRDFMPEVSDPGEMKAQRESLIRQSLTPEFLDSLGEKYGIYQVQKNQKPWPFGLQKFRDALYPATSRSESAVAREALLKRIQIFNMNHTTFHVSFIHSDPEVTVQVTRDIHAQVIRTLLDVHQTNLVNIRDAIRSRVESLAFGMTASPDPRVTQRPQIMKEELANVRNQIRALSTQFSEEHPTIVELRNREKLLASWQADGSSSEAMGQSGELMSSPSQEGVKEIYGDLAKKLSYLNIALDANRAHQGDYLATFESPLYPEKPLSPKKGLMALWGFALGFVGSLSIAALREYFKRTSLRTAALVEQLGIPLLGELPVVPWNQAASFESRP